MKKILFCGGGSAGHVIPNLSVIEDMREKYEVCYAGTDGIERELCKNADIPFYTFDAVKYERGTLLTNLKIPYKLFRSVRQAGRIIEEQRPDLVFCKGGYASLPPALAAKRRKIPVITHESDLNIGLANRIISMFAEVTLCSFPETAERIRRGKYSGTPMRASLFGADPVACRRKAGLDMRPTLLVFGGGGGSEAINAAIGEIADELCTDYNVLHICGKGKSTRQKRRGYKQIEFTNDMGAIYACADFAVARCGSNSANELIALKIPTLFIPLENSRSRGDQVANAEYFHKKGLCRVLPEKQLNAENLKSEIYALIDDRKIKAALDNYNCGRGNVFIINEITKVLR